MVGEQEERSDDKPCRVSSVVFSYFARMTKNPVTTKDNVDYITCHTPKGNIILETPHVGGPER